MNLLLLSDAETVAKGEGRPSYSRGEYEDAMLQIAEREARPGEGTAAAFARLCKEDSRVRALYQAAYQADVVQAQARPAQLAKSAGRSRDLWELMLKVARTEKRGDETVEKALDRLLRTEPVMRDAYAMYCELTSG
jgi:hypothetical protein